MKRKIYRLLVHLFFKDVAKEDFIKRLNQVVQISFTREEMTEENHLIKIGSNIRNVVEKNGDLKFTFLKF